MLNRIYIINGISGVGKDEFVKLYSKLSDSNVINLSSVEPIKNLISKAEDNMRSDFTRLLISDVKDMLDDSSDFTIKYLRKQIAKADKIKGDTVLFIHMREEYLISMIQALYSVKTILMTSDAVLATNDKDNLIGKAIMYDFEIENTFSTTSNLLAAASNLIKIENNDILQR